MKIQYKIGAIALAVVAMSSCEMHDPYDDVLEVGQPLPTVAWELGGTVATAGDSVAFRGQYYTEKGKTPDHSEVWALISKTESGEATLKLSSSLSYTKSFGLSDTIRADQKIAEYPHSMAEFDGYEYVLNAKFPTSQTLKTLSWGNTSEWEEDRFTSFFPKGFREEFTEHVIGELVKDAYYNDLRHVYINYDFKPEQFQAVIGQHAELDAAILNTLVLTDMGEKSDIWFANTEKVVKKYYKTVDAEGNIVYNEVDLDFSDPEITVYDVYESSPWVFCRYDDDQGKIITSVRPEYISFFKDLITLIPFTDWIYNTVDKNYSVSFTREYKMGVTFKVYDTDGNVGYTTDVKEVSLN